MNYRFDIRIEGKAVNEQWHDDAKMFVAAGTAALLHPTNQPWLKAFNCARLHEYAAEAYENAAGRTFGHGETDRYMEQVQLCKQASAKYYADADRLWKEMTATNS